MNTVVKLLIICFLQYKIHGKPTIRTDQLIETKAYENPNLFEGDILFPPVSTLTNRGVALRGSSVPWTNGIIPYEILPGYASTEISFIIATMQKMERILAVNNYKCIQFRPKISSDPYYITIVNGFGCSSYIGQNTGESMTRTVTLQHPGCIDDGRVMHELLHALGFYHEQSRPDRDQYVRVNYENIQSGMEHNFDKYSNTVVDTQNTSYDYQSVMHYQLNAFSNNGLPTIEPLRENIRIGQLDNMSSIDIEEVRLFYNCSSTDVTLPPIPTTTITANLYMTNTTISASLTTDNPKYTRFNGTGSNYFYDQYSIIVPVTGSYIFMSISSIDTFCQFYGPRAYARYYTTIAYNNNDGDENQFKIQMYLQESTRYIMRVTTYNQNIVGDYRILASGLTTVNIEKTVDSSLPSLNHSPRTIGTISNKLYYILLFFLLH